MNYAQLKHRQKQLKDFRDTLDNMRPVRERKEFALVANLTRPMISAVAEHLEKSRTTVRVTKICESCSQKISSEEAGTLLNRLDYLQKSQNTEDELNQYVVQKIDDSWVKSKKGCSSCSDKVVTASQDVIVFGQKFVLHVDGYSITASPYWINPSDVYTHADPRCKHCYGAGYQIISKPMRLPPGVKVKNVDFGNTLIKFQSACMCSRKNFLKQYPNVFMDTANNEWVMLNDLLCTPVKEEAVEAVQTDKPSSESKE